MDAKTQKQKVEEMRWFIEATEDGPVKHCILIAKIEENEIQRVSLLVAPGEE